MSSVLAVRARVRSWFMRVSVRGDDGLPLAGIDFGGQGRPILLLHGLMGRASTWWRTAQWLRRHGRVVGLDARGHGRSEARGPWTTEAMVADVAAAVRQLDLAPVVVIGHSMGGLHGWELAARHPELVAALVVEDMAPDHRGHTVDAWRAWFEAMPAAFDSLAAVREAFGPVGDYFVECAEERADGYHLLAEPAHCYAIAGEWGRRSYWDSAAAVRCPALLVESGVGPMPPGQMAELAARMPAARHLRIPGTGHLVHDDAPTAFRAAVTGLLTA